MQFGFLFLLVAVVLEFWSIGFVGGRIGFWATFILLVADFIFGLKLLRAQGLNSMLKSAQKMQAGESPMGAIAEGIVKAFAGILLIIPGFFTDVIALLLLIPMVRKGFARRLAKKGQFQGFASGGFGGFGGPGGFGGFGKPGANEGNIYDHEGSPRADDVIEGQVIEHMPDEKK